MMARWVFSLAFLLAAPAQAVSRKTGQQQLHLRHTTPRADDPDCEWAAPKTRTNPMTQKTTTTGSMVLVVTQDNEMTSIVKGLNAYIIKKDEAANDDDVKALGMPIAAWETRAARGLYQSHPAVPSAMDGSRLRSV